ncbi:MAG: hypothetical protein RL274_2168 [Pseudomonadota bacterium]|jgi:hypothetical protein
MKKIAIIALAASLLVPTAVLAQSGALTPGKPAGVRSAQMDRTTTLVVLGGAGILAAIVVGATNCCGSSNKPVPVAAAALTTV